VRGIALRTEELPLGDWIDGLSAALLAESASSEAARAALERLVQ
jgi:hypothetical protein